MRHRFSLVLPLLVLCAAGATAQTTIPGGRIFTTTWTKALAPYHIAGQCTVMVGDTLTIQPGVDVLFDADVQFVVQGRLQAVGMFGDSVRFIKGVATEWGGIRISGGDSSTIAYARISDGKAEGAPPNNNGGAIVLEGSGTRLGLSASKITANTSLNNGGGISVNSSAVATVSRCYLVGNTASGGGGSASVQNSGVLRLVNCTVYGNTALNGGGVSVESSASAVLTNCILWANNPQALYVAGGTVTATYSDIQGGYAGIGNINLDPLFVNPAAENFYLQALSPCIDTGDPTSPLDPDGTRADMGKRAYSHPVVRLTLPTIGTFAPGDTFALRVRGTFPPIYSVDIAFKFDSAVVTPDTVGKPFVINHAFVGKAGAIVQTNIVGDTVFASFVASELVSLDSAQLIGLRFRVRLDAPTVVSPLFWVTNLTNIEDVMPEMIPGSVTVQRIMYGDVSHDSSLSALDASFILKYVVRLIPDIDLELADVTCNGKITSFDAAWVLQKILNPALLFPCEGGGPLHKPAPGQPLALRWERDGSGWALRAEYGALLAGDLVLSLGNEAPVTVSGGDHLAFRQEGSTLRVAFVSFEGDEPVLLRFAGGVVMADAPRITFAQLNEGELAYTVALPAEFALEQNVPNPFNPTTAVRFSTPDAGVVNLAIYDVNGRLVRTLVDGTVEAGMHEVVWDGRDALGREVSSGLYIYRLAREQRTIVRRMVLVR